MPGVRVLSPPHKLTGQVLSSPLCKEEPEALGGEVAPIYSDKVAKTPSPPPLPSRLWERRPEAGDWAEPPLSPKGAELTGPLSPQRFLGDYGLQWVGEPREHEDSSSSEDDEEWMIAKKFWKPGRVGVTQPLQ